MTNLCPSCNQPIRENGKCGFCLPSAVHRAQEFGRNIENNFISWSHYIGRMHGKTARDICLREYGIYVEFKEENNIDGYILYIKENIKKLMKDKLITTHICNHS